MFVNRASGGILEAVVVAFAFLWRAPSLLMQVLALLRILREHMLHPVSPRDSSLSMA